MAKFLKQSRQNQGLTQKEAAEHFGWMSAQYISNMERDISLPPKRDLKKLANLYKVDLTVLVELMVKATAEKYQASLNLHLKESEAIK